MRRRRKQVLYGHKRSATSYVVESLIPFTDANLKLAFSPSRFFQELAKSSDTNADQLRRAYYRAKDSGIVKYIDGHFAIDEDYLATIIQHTTTPQLPDNESMLVIYDIPEEVAHKRQELRGLLRELEFVQVQKSVWQTSKNCLAPVLAMIAKLKIEPYVQVFVGTTEFDQYMLY